MGLEHTPQLFVGVMPGSCQRSRDFLWMMGIIINDGDSAYFTFFFKPAFRPGKPGKPLLNRLKRDVEGICRRYGRQSIVHIVLTGNPKMDPAGRFPAF